MYNHKLFSRWDMFVATIQNILGNIEMMIKCR